MGKAEDSVVTNTSALLVAVPLGSRTPIMLLLLLLLVLPSADVHAERVSGVKENDSCVCTVNSTMWSFPALRYEAVLEQVETCSSTLANLKQQLNVSSDRLPEIQALVKNLIARLEPYQYMHNMGVYTDLSLEHLAQKIVELEVDVRAIHSQQSSQQTDKLVKEVSKLRGDVERRHMSNSNNMKAIKERLRYLKNTVESSKTIPRDFRAGQDRHCPKGLMTNISEPVVTKVSSTGKSYLSGSWGKQAERDSEEEPDSYFILPLLNSEQWSNSIRLYKTYHDFMATAKYRDYNVAPSYSHTNAIEGPSTVLYGGGLYYHCYRSADVCRIDLKTNAVHRAPLPGVAADYMNKFPYCYYDCRVSSDVDLEADERGLWVIYTTVQNRGNLVVSRLEWDQQNQTLSVGQTWETRLFKKATTNAFIVCGVLYATRYVDVGREEVFYAFDTATGQESNTLALPLEKVAKGVASLSYNPTDKRLYMYNDGYLLAYQAHF